MSSHAVKLDEPHFRAAQEKARAIGTTPDEYLQRLIDLDLLSDQSFDELLAPVRKGFEHLSDDELDTLFDQARQRAAEPDK